MSTDKYNWNKLFRERIIALCFIPRWFARFGYSIIKPEYMETRQEQDLVKFVVDFYKAYKRVPDEDEVLTDFEDDDEVQELLFNVMDLLDANDDLSYAQERALQFAKEQAMKLAILDSVRDIDTGYLSKIIPRVRDALQVGKDMTDIGIDLKKDLDIWIPNDLTAAKIQTNLPHLDEALGGGAGRGEYIVFLGSTNVGKTQMLVNIGVGSAGLPTKYNVVHLTFEMSAKKIARRYGARIADGWYDEEIGFVMYKERFQKNAKLRLPGNVVIKQWPPNTCTISDINSYLDRLDALDYDVDVLIVDYPDIMKHERVGELRHNISNTTTELRTIAVERDIAVWGASQANRAALNKEIVDLDMIAEDYGKVQIADVVLAICQTKEEYEDKIIRIFAAKMRDGEKNWIVRCRQHPEQHAIESLELMSFSKHVERKKDRTERKLMTKSMKQIKEQMKDDD